MSTQGRRNVRDGNPMTPAIEIGAAMYLPKIYDQAAHAYRVRYAIANILRDHTANEGAFKGCFEMEDGDGVILAILRRGLKYPSAIARKLSRHSGCRPLLRKPISQDCRRNV